MNTDSLLVVLTCIFFALALIMSGFFKLVELNIISFPKKKEEIENQAVVSEIQISEETRQTTMYTNDVFKDFVVGHKLQSPFWKNKMTGKYNWWFIVLNKFFTGRSPHIMLVGETGAGKTSIAYALLRDLAQIGEILIIDPHGTPDEWGTETVVGRGKIYEDINAALCYLKNMMDERFIERAQGKKTSEFTPLFVFIDELPCIAKNKVTKETWKEAFPELVREARKVRISLVLITQSILVKSIGIEGEGDIRDNFDFILIDTFARKALPQETFEGFNKDRPCVIQSKSDKYPVQQDFVLELGRQPIQESALHKLPFELTPLGTAKVATHSPSFTEVDARLLKVAWYLGKNPGASDREIARHIYPNSKTGGGSYSTNVKVMRSQINKIVEDTESELEESFALLGP